MKALPDDAGFIKRASQFVLLRVDTRNGQAKQSVRLGVNRNRTYFLALDAKGNEIARVFGPGPRATQSLELLLMMDHALAKKKGAPLLKRLRQQLKHPDHRYRADAVEAIGKQGAAAVSAVPALLPMLADRAGKPTVSWYTMHALRGIGARAKAAIPHLQKLLADKKRPDVEKQTALITLGRLDPQGKTILPTLRDALQGNGTLVVGAAIAVTSLGPAAAPLEVDLEAAVTRYPRGGVHGYLRKALAAIYANPPR